ncbi:hypothetical protein [Marinomonas mediterranea]|jgi:hypothetical protein|uniref:Lipoprotein n=1 Tax=Marinomonas mediterranea (strain ATCC 700492 / JCM 21426 / NBRC 103028 / MMB-1) TaxID=717774 RepID=F2JTX3_MARM1|nr:hypothetical protein [Marinomonas mediterranea]ADZ90394.1 hypothetical protein Marme_1119 [Marinomonas mediterranea MMB-1]WCN08450.1 hypothetical protein GV055_05690 [Marinomonas mediterranea]WCN12504.1 hypothetical protein GV054_05530 [Marinomonas mediterranea]WCN16576.1 hypothetical protein GV053_05660 [Marinomonas mediterranea MMB-1]
MQKLYFTGLMAAILTIGGCDMFGGPAADIADADLRKKWRECKSISNPSRTKVLACENYERECSRRKGKGNLVCY